MLATTTATTSQPPLQPALDRLLCRLIPWFLLVDCLNGALLQTLGSSYGLAAGYKLILLLLMALSLTIQQPRWLLLIALSWLTLLIGPMLQWPALPARWALADLQLTLKLLSPLLALAYLYALAQRSSVLAARLLKHSLLLSSLVLLLNALAGIAGLGFTAYQPLDGVAQSFLGIKGFFYSTNELSAVLLVLTAALLCLSWQHKRYYALVSGCALLLALSLLTKTGLFGVMLLILLVPLLLQQRDFWQAKRKLIGLLALAVALVLLLVIVNGEALLKLLGIYDKLSFVYQQRGISGIVLSSRDYYAGRIWQLSSEQYSMLERLLGVGQGGVALYLKKYFAELDWFDLLVFYGIAGISLFVVVFAVFIRHSWRLCYSGAGRVLLLLNLLLLVVSSLAGHILTSGMLWLPWALCNALLLQLYQAEHDERSA
ncbi:O-antigen ligase family protein [Rheinheimera sp. FR7-31]|uniref:O-antigen ligase family protein n=1 Tax=Rheinheimera fenheensis TaxID=3152295 RepID=UPI00325C5D71